MTNITVIRRPLVPMMEVVWLTRELTGAQLKVICIIQTRFGPLSIKDIAQAAGLSRRSVIRALKKLLKIGLVDRDNLGLGFAYRVNWDSYIYTCYRCREPIEKGMEEYHRQSLCQKYKPKKNQSEITRDRWSATRGKKRTLVFERGGWKCALCNSIENLTIDHIIPISKGGTIEIENLQVLCRSCNSRKRDK